jgi:hypothetical protein
VRFATTVSKALSGTDNPWAKYVPQTKLAIPIRATLALEGHRISVDTSGHG